MEEAENPNKQSRHFFYYRITMKQFIKMWAIVLLMVGLCITNMQSEPVNPNRPAKILKSGERCAEPSGCQCGHVDVENGCRCHITPPNNGICDDKPLSSGMSAFTVGLLVSVSVLAIGGIALYVRRKNIASLER